MTSPLSEAKPNTAVPLSEHFFGRAKELQQLKDHLLDSNIKQSPVWCSSNAVVLSSQAHGTGKTQLAAAFCWKNRAEFRSILWFSGETESTFRKSCYDNAERLELVQDLKNAKYDQHEEICKRLQLHLKKNDCKSQHCAISPIHLRLTMS